MKRILKISLLSCWFLISFSGFAQKSKDSYSDLEARRIEKARLIENKIENFITKNIDNYELTDDFIKRYSLKSIDHEGHNHEESKEDIKTSLIKLKRHELRKLFFTESPEKVNFFVATQSNNQYRLECTDGNFEGSNPLEGYTFWSSPIAADSLGCNIDLQQLNGNLTTSTTNDAKSKT